MDTLHPYILIFCRSVVGLLFTLSFAGKVVNSSDFGQAIRNFRILPNQLSYIAAIFILCIEFLIIVLMFIGDSFLTVGFFFAGFTLVAFSLAILLVLLRDLRIDCNCFGPMYVEITYYDLLRNVGFLGATFVGFVESLTSKVQLSQLEFFVVFLIAIVYLASLINLREIVLIFKLLK